MDISAFITAVVGDQVTNFIVALLIFLPLIDFVTGTLRAIANKTFKLELVDVFVRTQLAGRAIPLVILLFTGRAITVAAPTALVIPGVDLSILTAGGAVAAAPFLLATIKSIFDNANAGAPDKLPSATEEGPLITPDGRGE